LYRLDFETSGVLVYIKNETEYLNLRQNFKNIAKRKRYYCLVEGECKLDGVFTHYFSSRGVKGKRVVVSANETQGERGELTLSSQSYDPITRTTLIIVDLKTGLRHQIRAQLAYLGFPLRGDLFYGGNAAHRLYLHAFEYEINFSKKNYLFQAKLKEFNGL
jgi:23S rRNA pseudouridine1911/1915/1917 synthase